MSSSTRLLLLLLVLGPAAPPVARADADAAVPASLAQRIRPPGVGDNDAPRFVRSDDMVEPGRSLAGYRNGTTELGYRWWLSTGRADLGLGLGLGTLSSIARPTGSVPGLGTDGSVLASGTVLTVGMRYRTSARSSVFADAASWFGDGLSGDAVIGKVGLEFKTAKSSWNLVYGGLGLTLPGNAHMMLRVRRGGLGLYLRSSF